MAGFDFRAVYKYRQRVRHIPSGEIGIIIRLERGGVVVRLEISGHTFPVTDPSEIEVYHEADNSLV